MSHRVFRHALRREGTLLENHIVRHLFITSLLLCLGCGPENSSSVSESGMDTSAGEHEGQLGKADGFGEEESPEWASIKARRVPPDQEEPVLYSSAFRWGYDLESMRLKFDEIYSDKARLFGRAYFDESRSVFILPDVPIWGGEVILTKRLIESVKAHIETALKYGYADFIFFPDMGHSHLFIPQDRWDDVYAGFALENLSSMRSAVLDDPDVRILYHTAEQLELLDTDDVVKKDPDLMWRYFTRNPVGDNQGLGRLDLIRDLETAMNTARDLPGYHYYGAGFNLSANANGCFPFVHEGVVRYFDISLFDLKADPRTIEAGSF